MSQPPSPPPPTDGKVAGLIRAVQGLTLANVLVIFLLAAISVPLYVLYKAINDEELLDRLLSTYREIATGSNCILREAKTRGGPDLWAISTGFAMSGADRYIVAVILNHQPDAEETDSYCQSVKLIADKLTNGSTE